MKKIRVEDAAGQTLCHDMTAIMEGDVYKRQDAFSAGLEVVDTATAEMCGQVIYTAAVLNITQHEEEAKAFLDYLQTDEAVAVFESVGFSPAF